MENNKNLMNGFYLDVARYTFDYLFESRRKSVIISLNDSKEKRIMGRLLEKCFYQNKSSKLDCVEFTMFELGIKGEYVNKEATLTFVEYVDALMRYARDEDSKVFKYTRKRLFQESLNYGFNRLK